MKGSASSIHFVFPIGVFASPLRPRHLFTGRCKYAANLLALSLGTTMRCKYEGILARRMCLIVARPSLKCPFAGEVGATIHCKYEANLVRRRLETGPRQGLLGEPRGGDSTHLVATGWTPGAGPKRSLPPPSGHQMNGPRLRRVTIHYKYEGIGALSMLSRQNHL